MKEKDIKELRAISSSLMFEREILIKPTKRFIDLLISALDEVESNAKSEKESKEKSMLHNVTVRKAERKKLSCRHLLLGLKENISHIMEIIISHKTPPPMQEAVAMRNRQKGKRLEMRKKRKFKVYRSRYSSSFDYCIQYKSI